MWVGAWRLSSLARLKIAGHPALAEWGASVMVKALPPGGEGGVAGRGHIPTTAQKYDSGITVHISSILDSIFCLVEYMSLFRDQGAIAKPGRRWQLRNYDVRLTERLSNLGKCCCLWSI